MFAQRAPYFNEALEKVEEAQPGIGAEREMVTLMAGSHKRYVPDRESERSLTRSLSRDPSPARKQPPKLMKKSLFTADGSPVLPKSPPRDPSPDPFAEIAAGSWEPLSDDETDPPLQVLQTVAGPKPKAKSDGLGMAAIGVVALGIVLMVKGTG